MNRIICSAIYINDETNHISQPKNIEIGFVICGWRHFNCMHLCKVFGFDFKKFSSQGNVVQGFLTSDNLFVDRNEGAKIAINAGQVNEDVDVLYSEDLY